MCRVELSSCHGTVGDLQCGVWARGGECLQQGASGRLPPGRLRLLPGPALSHGGPTAAPTRPGDQHAHRRARQIPSNSYFPLLNPSFLTRPHALSRPLLLPPSSSQRAARPERRARVLGRGRAEPHVCGGALHGDRVRVGPHGWVAGNLVGIWWESGNLGIWGRYPDTQMGLQRDPSAPLTCAVGALCACAALRSALCQLATALHKAPRFKGSLFQTRSPTAPPQALSPPPHARAAAGRYVATAVTAQNQMENGTELWSFAGQLLYK